MQLLEFGILGLATGSLYGLVSLGVVLTYRASGVLNFSAGAVGSVGAFLTYNLRDSDHVPWVVAVLVGLLSGAVLGGLTQVLVMDIMRRSSLVSKLVATLGVFSLAQGLITLAWPSSQNTSTIPFPNSVLPTQPIHLFGISNLLIGEDRLIIIGVVIVVAAILRLVYSKTMFGLATSAVAENAPAAAAGGLSTRAIELANFTLSGVLAAGAAILLAPILGLGAAGLALIIVPAIAAALLGRFSSFAITMVGAALIGILQTEITRFLTDPSLAGLSDAVPLLAIVAYTVVGGRTRPARGDIVARLPLPGNGKVSAPRVAAGFAVTVVLGLLLNASWTLAITVWMAMAVLVLSLVVLTGYTGQLSLGQAALAGFGAWVAAHFFMWHVPFPIAIILGVLLTVPIGLLVALPALRTRGVTLAVATMALGELIYSLILTNGALTGGFTGLVVQNESFLGINVDPIEHPQRYTVLTLVAFTLVALLVANIRRGRVGRRLLAVRGNERAAAALGIGVYGAKLYAFGVASAIAALGGIFIAFQNNYLDFSQFQVINSITIVEYAVIGGMGWVGGALLGAFGVPGAPIPYYLTSVFDVNSWIVAFAGLATILTIAFAPNGLAAQMADAIRTRRYDPIAIVVRVIDRVKVRAAREQPVEPRRNRIPSTLEAENITVRFGGLVALDAVSLEVEPGEVLGIIGPNGAGKTTLVDILTGFTRQSQGEVRLNGQKIDGWSPERRSRAGIGRCWQAVDLFDGLTVEENLLVAADNQSRSRYFLDLFRPGQTPRSDLIDEVISLLGLADALHEQPSSLPHGRARLVGIARALVAQPGVIMLDEPAAGLDTHESQELVSVIRTLAKQMGMGVILIEHDVPLVTSVCDRIICLNFGSQIAEGTPVEILANPEVTGAYLGGAPVTETTTSEAEDAVSP